jgi:hypothetical protein
MWKLTLGYGDWLSLVVWSNTKPICFKIKIQIDINNDELLKAIWKHMREMKREDKGGII